MIFTIVSTLAIGLLATLRLERGRALPVTTAGLYALAAIVPSLLALILAYLRVTQFDRSIPFALFSVVLAADFYLAAYRFGRPPEAARTPATRLATGAFAAGVAAAITLAFVMVLERGYLTVAFAVTALTTAIVAERHRIPLLRAVVVAIGFIVLGRLIWDPRIMGAAVGTIPGLQLAAARLRHPGRSPSWPRASCSSASARIWPCAFATRWACCLRRCWCSTRSATRSTAAIRWPTPRAMSSRGCSR